jgi:hypothetical protein
MASIATANEKKFRYGDDDDVHVDDNDDGL